MRLDLSIIVPCFNEGNNVRTLAYKITENLQVLPCRYEIIFVDDSRDNTPAILQELKEEFFEISYIYREHERGLGTAVVTGFANSRGDKIIVMDADLQHPPELLPKIIAQLATHDIVIPSRFIAGGSGGGLNLFRRFVSWLARKLGQVFIKKLRHISDCTGGYFGLKRQVISNVQLNPIGWKILIEILVKGHYISVHEVPYEFNARDEGDSKMSLKEQWNYLRHIVALVIYNFKSKKAQSKIVVTRG
jgi:dolichol-phosphate mannosyltransferase